MTRFARAHGSKASNERQPEEATSWKVLKEQLLEQQSASKDKLESASEPNRKSIVMKKVIRENTEWAEFEETPEPKHIKIAKKNKKLGMSTEKVVEKLSLDEQHSSKSTLHKIKKSSNIKNEKKLGKKLKKIKGQKVQMLHSNGLEDLEQVIAKTKQQVTVLKLEKRKNKLKVLEKSIDSFNPQSPTDTRAKLKTKKLKINGQEEQKLHSNSLGVFEQVLAKAKPQVTVSKREKRKNKLKVLEKSIDSFNPESPTDTRGAKLKTKKLKIKGQEEQKLLSNSLRDFKQAKPQVAVSKREKRKNKLKILEKSIESLNPESLTNTRAKLKTVELVDGSTCELGKRQLKRLKHKLKKALDNGFDLKPPLKIDNKQKTKRLDLQVESLENGNGKEGKSKLSKQQKGKMKSQLKKQVTTTSSNILVKVERTNTPVKVERTNTPVKVERTNTLVKMERTDTPAEVEKTDQTQSHSKLQVQSKRQKRNLKKLGDPTKVKVRKRRKPDMESATMVLNGQEIEVAMFDGFPVRKQDADRLKELRKQMVANGIPAKEIEESIKLERRKAEKSLSRERHKVCFHCRQGGHNLSDCPKLTEGSNQDAAGTGICFKCGSTEHTHFECRVVRGQEFRFAKCFICQEQGHISRQCPDNPRGLYPKGGGCKVCGDVTHLKKDCPDLHEKKEQNVITLDTARGDKLEALDEDLRMEDNRPAVAPRKNKIIKF